MEKLLLVSSKGSNMLILHKTRVQSFHLFDLQDRIKDLNSQADQFAEAGVWDMESIVSRKKTINERYEK